VLSSCEFAQCNLDWRAEVVSVTYIKENVTYIQEKVTCIQ